MLWFYHKSMTDEPEHLYYWQKLPKDNIYIPRNQVTQEYTLQSLTLVFSPAASSINIHIVRSTRIPFLLDSPKTPVLLLLLHLYLYF